ncbi:MAG: thiamine phosphate synthase [Bacteroidia bacterium]
MYNRLQYISQGSTINEHIRNINLALDNGCRWIQLRIKAPLPPERGIPEGAIFVPSLGGREAALKVKQLCASYKATFIVNDYIDIAKEADADGVHLGLQDSSVANAREVLGSKKIIGGSANTYSDCLMRIKEGCNYIGLGPFRYTTTKAKLSPILGTEGFRKIMSQLSLDKNAPPVYAIGGIVAEDVEELMDTGIYGIAVSGVITNATDKKQIIKSLNFKLNQKHVNHSR